MSRFALPPLLFLAGCGFEPSSMGLGTRGSILEPDAQCAGAIEALDGTVADTACISAARGGIIELTGPLAGGRLEIPPGALAEDTTIGVLHPTDPVTGVTHLVFEPDGLEFETPARIVVPTEAPVVPGAEALWTVAHGSLSHPEVDVGGERHRFQPLANVAFDADALELSGDLPHFSELFVMQGVERPAYLVLDIPSRYLRPGDALFVLTSETPNWFPGHVGMVNSVDPDTGAVEVIEATTEGGQQQDKNGVQTNPLVDFKTSHNHVYMGARRPRVQHSDGQRMEAVFYARELLGRPYSALGYTGSEGVSCSGLVEASWEAADGQGVGGLLDFWISPVEMFERTEPIRELSIEPYEEFAMPLRPVGIAEESQGMSMFWDGWYVTGREFGDVPLTVSGLPPGAELEIDYGEVERPWTFRWTPTWEDIGQTYTVTFRMQGWRVFEAGLFDGVWQDVGMPYDVTETLTLTVRGGAFDWPIHPVSIGQTGTWYSGFVPVTGEPREGGLIDLATGEPPVNPVFEDQVYDEYWQGWRDDSRQQWGCGFHMDRLDDPWTPGPVGEWREWVCWFDEAPVYFTGLE